MNAEKYFKTRNLYKILEVTPTAEIQVFYFYAVKKSYYRLACMFHPDRASEDDKDVACEKFNIIHNAYSILSDPVKKQMYDDGSNVLFSKVTIAARWEIFLKPVSQDDIEAAKNKYCGSRTE